MEIVDPDYIVVGAGSAGCILAAELSQDGKNSILLLEAGPTDFHPYVKIPLGYGLLFKDDTRNYRYESVPEKMLGNRKLYVPRGKVVGGSGSINAMVYCRGMPSDYDDWKRSGLVNWGWEEAKSAFQANEKRDPYGTGVMVTNPIAERHPFTAVFAAACEELAVPHCDDFNGTSSEGWGYYHITTQSGARHSAADAFLRPALRKGGVRLVTNAVVQRINMAHGRAVGVTFIKNSTSHSVRARRAVVLSAGAINSPQILQVSGIGDGAYLQKIGVNTLVDNRNVGAHLQEHLTIGYYYMSFAPTLNSQLHSLPAKIFQTVRYLFTRRGPLSNSVNQFGGFIRTSSELSAPDQQIYFNPVTYTVARSSGGRHVQADAFPAFTLSLA